MPGFWTIRRAAKALGLSMPDDRPLTGVSTDTRRIATGDLFVALRGERFDAHDFLAQAVQSGAAAVVVDDATKAAGIGVPALVVPNTLTALGALARFYREAWGRPVVAIGGSNGKTSTKELIRATLSAVFEVHATEANFNNQIGVPLTLLSVPDSADIAVVEVGTNQPGEIALLREIVQPSVAVITTVQEEHLEGFGDLAGVMREELALCDGVALAVVPGAEPAVVAEARKRAKRVVTAGVRMGDVSPGTVGLDREGRGWMEFGQLTMRVPVPGMHNIANAALAVAVARSFGMSDADVARGIAQTKLPSMRSAVTTLGPAILVNDAYNANPASMVAALDLLQSVAAGRITVAVLGTMRELGARTAELHDDIARKALASDLAIIGAVGEFAAAFDRVARDNLRVVAAPDPDALWPKLRPRLPKEAAILLKGSRGVKLERLLPHLAEWAGVPLAAEDSH